MLNNNVLPHYTIPLSVGKFAKRKVIKSLQKREYINFATPFLGDEQRCNRHSAPLPRAEHLYPGRLSARPGTLQPLRAGPGHPSPGWGGGGRGAGSAGLVGPGGEDLEPRPLPRYKGEEGVCRLLLQQAGPLCSSTRAGWQHRCQVSARIVSSIVEY
jgi:hypothetical protein